MKANSLFNVSFVIVYTAIRVGLANMAPITDCDEVYNYWEPLHFLHHGSGMQTWEYAPQYALRTYFYLLPMSCLSQIYEFLLQTVIPNSWISILQHCLSLNLSFIVENNDYNGNNMNMNMNMNYSEYSNTVDDYDDNHKVLVFRLLRCTLALATALSELRLCQSLTFLKLSHAFYYSDNHNNNPPTSSYSQQSSSISSIPFWTLFLLLTSAGMFHAGPAYLPSSTVMLLWMNSASHQLQSYKHNNIVKNNTANTDDTSYINHIHWAVLWGLLAVLGTGWPFSAILFIPLGIHSLFRVKNPISLLTKVFILSILLQSIVMLVDYHYYGTLLSPTLRIFTYNASSNSDNLYGVEPLSYYIKNILLNWNVVAILGILSLPILCLTHFILSPPSCNYSSKQTFIQDMRLWILLPMYLWLILVLPRPHKEERFLFPIYPILAIGTSIVLDELLDRILCHSHHYHQRKKLILGLLILSPMALLSISRAATLSTGYTSPLQLYNYIHKDIIIQISKQDKQNSTLAKKQPIVICTGGEWYRFPSSFHLPTNAKLAFLKSSFTGQLPKPFHTHGSRIESLPIQIKLFNDRNQDINNVYETIENCSYVVELYSPHQFGTLSNSCTPPDITTSTTTSIPECITYMNEDEGGLSTTWTNIMEYDFLDAQKTSTLHRILYIPGKRRRVEYLKYAVFRRREYSVSNQ